MNRNVLIAGDSYTEAAELRANDSYISHLCKRFLTDKYGICLSHFAQSGICSSELIRSIKSRLDSQSSRMAPRLFVWQCGTNDCRFLDSDQQSVLKSRAERLFNELLLFESVYSAKTIYIAPPLLFPSSQYASQFNPGLMIFREHIMENLMSRNPSIDILDLDLLVKRDKSLFVDQIHLNSKAHKLVYELLFRKIILLAN
jgi:lysophospholipase L1-like esterase